MCKIREYFARRDIQDKCAINVLEKKVDDSTKSDSVKFGMNALVLPKPA